MPNLKLKEISHSENLMAGIRLRRALIVCFIISVLVHLALILSDMEIEKKEIKVKSKPISVKFIQKAPRLVKPLELTKRPTIIQRALTRRLTQTRTASPRSMRTATMHGGTVLASLARPGEVIERKYESLQRVDLGPTIIAGKVESVKEAKIKNLNEDLLNASQLDYGRYASFAVQNPANKRDVKGFVHLALIKYRTNFKDAGGEPDWNTSPLALKNIAEFVEKYSGVKADFRYILTLDTDEILAKKIPIIFLQGHNTFEFTEQDADNLGRYLRTGGFLLVDDSRFLKGGPFDIAARSLIRKALREDGEFEQLPNDHLLYQIFFDFNGPPPGDDVLSTWDRPGGSKTIYEYLDAIFLDGRMVVLFSNKSLNNAWNYDHHWRPAAGNNNVRQLQFGANIVIFALLQTGGFTQQAAQYR